MTDNLAGQLWFGAECLAAGSSIMHKESESEQVNNNINFIYNSIGKGYPVKLYQDKDLFQMKWYRLLVLIEL